VAGMRWGDMELLNTVEAIADISVEFQVPPGF
jgi:hypothetical protein